MTVVFWTFLINFLLLTTGRNTIKLSPTSHTNIPSKTVGTPSVFVEAIWDRTTHSHSAVQAGEQVVFTCRIWRQAHAPTDLSVNAGTNPSVFLYCPLSLAYCAQDCLLVDSKWPIDCSQQYRSFRDFQIPATMHQLPRIEDGWELQEVMYKMRLAIVGATGNWRCSYGGFQSNALNLSVRDRPVLLQFTSNPSSPVTAGTSVNLTCRAAPSPNSRWYKFIWRRSGSSNPPTHATLRLSDTVSVLIIQSVSASDDGLYVCQVANMADTSSGFEEWAPGNDRHGPSTHSALNLDLVVYHPPRRLRFRTDPIGPHRVGDIIQLLCNVEGGKPIPLISFYRRASSMPGGDENPAMTYFNSTIAQPNGPDSSRSSSTSLKWIIRDSDHEVEFGCSAASIIIPGSLLSTPVMLVVIFPPGAAILIANPQSAISENRTRIFTCRSSSGSNPVAKIHWRLFTSIDYMMSIQVFEKRLEDRPTSALNRLRNEASSTGIAHTFEPHEIPDFEASQTTSRQDPRNRGYIAYSEARLIGRPWYNGARVRCHLEWPANADGNGSRADIDGFDIVRNEFAKPVYIHTEILFAPLAVSLTVTPRNGIQETVGHQILECSTTSSIPIASIEWIERKTNDTIRRIGDSTESSDEFRSQANDTIIQNSVIKETLPGLYGGKRLISRLKVTNKSRQNDRTWYICKVNHVEWTKSVARAHQLMVLYPPELKLRVTPKQWPERMKTTHTVLECDVSGGRPPYPSMEGPSGESLYQVDHGNHSQLPLIGEDPSIWRFSWSFVPTYPEPGISSKNNNSILIRADNELILIGKNKPMLILSKPSRKEFGRYICQLDGPGGRARVSNFLEFAFSPELAPPETTVYTAPVGYRSAVDLFVWAFPHPFIGRQSATGGVDDFTCDQSSMNRIRNVENFNYTWYRVSTKLNERHGTEIISRQQIKETSSHVQTGIEMIDLQSLYAIPKLISVSANASVRGIGKRNASVPTLIYRLIFTPVQEEDFGEYLCEVHHITGRKAFLVRFQKPDPFRNHSYNTSLVRQGLKLYIQFDLKQLMPDSNIHARVTDGLGPNSFGHSFSNEPIFKWMLLRICPSAIRKTPQIDEIGNSELCHHNSQLYSNQEQKDCVHRLIGNPDRGNTIVHLNRAYKSGDQPSMYELGLDTVQSTIAQFNQPFGLSTEANWSSVNRLKYQFRFYDTHGSLVHITDWFYESDVPNPGQSDNNTAGNSVLWLTSIGGMVIFIVFVMLLLLMHQKFRKQKIPPVMNNPCLSLKNSLAPVGGPIFKNSNCDFKTQIDSYIPSSPVLDSPFPIVRLSDKPKNGQIIFKQVFSSTENNHNPRTIYSPVASIRLLPDMNTTFPLQRPADCVECARRDSFDDVESLVFAQDRFRSGSQFNPYEDCSIHHYCSQSPHRSKCSPINPGVRIYKPIPTLNSAIHIFNRHHSGNSNDSLCNAESTGGQISSSSSNRISVPTSPIYVTKMRNSPFLTRQQMCSAGQSSTSQPVTIIPMNPIALLAKSSTDNPCQSDVYDNFSKQTDIAQEFQNSTDRYSQCTIDKPKPSSAEECTIIVPNYQGSSQVRHKISTMENCSMKRDRPFGIIDDVFLEKISPNSSRKTTSDVLDNSQNSSSCEKPLSNFSERNS